MKVRFPLIEFFSKCIQSFYIIIMVNTQPSSLQSQTLNSISHGKECSRLLKYLQGGGYGSYVPNIRHQLLTFWEGGTDSRLTPS